MNKFEVGMIYSTRSIGDSNCIWSYIITSRTEKFVSLKDVDSDESTRCKIKIDDRGEYVLPQGRFSMCPVLRA